MDNNTNTGQQKGKKRWLFWGLGLAVTGVLSFFGFRYWNENKHKTSAPDGKAPDFKATKPKQQAKPKPATAAKPSKQAAPKANPMKTAAQKPKSAPGSIAAFPIQYGSKGEKVKALQEALIAKHGKTILKKGADGIYGNDLKTALQKLKLPETINETTFNVITQKKQINAPLIAKGIYASILSKSFTAAITLLNKIKSAADYTAVNNVFRTFFLNGVRQTLVNGMLGSFKTDEQQQAIRLAFAGMGLKYDGKKWALAGVDNQPLLITTRPTKVWKDPRTSVPVPENMVLGKEMERKKNFSLFESDGQFFLVESASVIYYKR